jgi:hypothetical protein
MAVELDPRYLPADALDEIVPESRDPGGRLELVCHGNPNSGREARDGSGVRASGPDPVLLSTAVHQGVT